MFPSFTGSSRKPRQVNLSGRRNTPQAKQIPGLSTQSHQHSSALLLAQQQRAKRETERKELEAAKKIQSTWRGRRDIAERRVLWRKEWDDKFGAVLSRRKVRDIKEAVEAIRLFLGFFDRAWSSGRAQKRTRPRQSGEDMQRLVILVQALTMGSGNMVPHSIDFREFYTLHRFVAIILSTTFYLSPTSPHGLGYILIVLNLIAEIPAVALSVIEDNGFFSGASNLVSPTYYEALSHITTSFKTSLNASLQDLLFKCLLGPLSASFPASLQRAAPTLSQVYRAFSRFILTSPNLRESLGYNYFHALAATLDISELADAVLDNLEEEKRTRNTTSSRRPERESGSMHTSDESKLWLLAYVIFFVRNKLHSGTFHSRLSGNSYVRCLTILLGGLAKEVGFRIDLQDHDMGGSGTADDPMQITDDYDDETDLDRDGNFYRRKGPLPDFVKEQLHTLIDQSSISSLLSGTSSFTRISGQLAETSEALEAQLLASYSLTLLLVFPTKREELRLWLYLSSTADGIPTVRYLWEAVKRSRLFTEVSADPNAAVNSLRKKRGLQNKSESNGWRTGSDLASQRLNQQYQGLYGGKVNDDVHEDDDNDWRVALLFLELYSFLLIVMDDDDFFNAGKDPSINGEEGSRTRDSAPPLDDVKDLTVFLKNLAFAMYWYSGEILKQGQRITGVDTPSSVSGEVNSAPGDLEVAGVKGMGFTYVKGLVTKLLRMVYLRDSRRRFLPPDHWLMTSRFDMEGFIPAVVAEEENRHQLEAEEEENAPDDEIHTFPGPSNRFENLRKQPHGQQKNHYLAAVAPRLEILQHLPFFIPFATRVQIFREFVSVDQRRRRGGSTDPDAWRAMVFQTRTRHGDPLSKHHARIRRESVFDDAFTEFYPLGEGLKEPIQITFIDQFGAQEAGIDGGGVTKEFLTSVTKEAFVPERYNLFLENKHHMLYPNPNSIEELRANMKDAGRRPGEIEHSVLDLLRRYEFLGRIVGKCIYEGILVDINFTGVFLLQWSYGKNNGYKPGVNDLKDLDEELYQGLVTLKNYTGDVEVDFALNFTITNSLSLSNGKTKTITIDLKPNGSNIPVTNSTRLEYIHLVSKYRLLIQPRVQINAFLQGLGSIIKPSWLSMFNQTELQTLVGGGDNPIDVADLRKHTVYGGLYAIGDDGMEHPVVQNFWKVMEDDLTDEERRKVLKFVTSVSRAPLLGFGMLNPRFSIRDSSDDQERLPSTSTCVNLLKLPRYKDRETLRKKLLYAVNAGAGFDLS